MRAAQNQQYHILCLQGFISADGNQPSVIMGLINVARALGLEVEGGRGGWQSRTKPMPSTGEGRQENLDTGEKNRLPHQ